MNISFLVILFIWLIFGIFLKNFFKVNTKGYRKYAWLIIYTSILATIEPLFIYSKNINEFSHFLYLSISLQLIISPSFFLLLRHRPRKSFDNSLRNIFHYGPALLALVFLFPHLSLGTIDKRSLIGNTPASVTVLQQMIILHYTFYLVWMISILNVFNRKKINWSDSRWIVVMGFSGYTTILILQLFNTIQPSLSIIIAQLALVVLVAWYLYFHSSKKTAKQTQSDVEIFQAVDRAMNTDKLFLQDNLNLQILSNTLAINANKISKAINSHLSKSFNDYINTHRVEEVIRLLNDNSNNKYTLEAISKMAGFRSVTTFNAAFKKHTGKTPKQYKSMTDL